jgi:muconolactone delta-isomerase
LLEDAVAVAVDRAAPIRQRHRAHVGQPDGEGSEWAAAVADGVDGDRRQPMLGELCRDGERKRFMAIMGPWEYLGIFTFPDNEAAFSVLGKIAKLEVFDTETFPAEDVEIFFKTLV